jgi:protein FAM32A
MSSEYASIPSSGKLKLKGVKDSKIEKKKKKKTTTSEHNTTTVGAPTHMKGTDDSDFVDNSVVLKHLNPSSSTPGNLPSKSTTISNPTKTATSTTPQPSPNQNPKQNEDPIQPRRDEYEETTTLKTPAELRHELQRRKRLEDRLRKEGGAKTHKQRVEELNRYLSGLSEHHDMPKIGPG